MKQSTEVLMNLSIDETKKETVGKVAIDLQKSNNSPVSAIDQMRESLSEYEQNVFECVELGKRSFVNQDFYIIVTTKKERLLENVIRNFFYSRISCPTPDWDQTVYKFKRKGEQLVFMWVIPDKNTCRYMLQSEHLLPREEQHLLKYVKADQDGTLLKLAKELNGEKSDSSLLEDFKFKG